MLLTRLQQLLQQTELTISTEQQRQLIDFVELLVKWNKAYNLTSVRDPEQMLVKHIVDSLVVSPHLIGQRFIDVGTGAGLPGIPLAIAHPDSHFVLLDSLGKRIRFLTHVKSTLKLKNITVVQSRVEDHQPEIQLDGVISRAFASMSDMVNWCSHLIEPKSRFFALKGLYPQEEIEALGDSVTVAAVQRLEVPELTGERHLVILEKR
ncbi:MAG: 16S rRNA (guanine(527)-N(7))-methyltransferase RsmG [Psychrosphaera sp.]|nr:16S rRNA (guanine(527)-N(7))-methyltransferase RsmG [Psychrosphaera sp.]